MKLRYPSSCGAWKTVRMYNKPAGSPMRKTALLHIKFAPCATRGSFSSLFIRCFSAHNRGSKPFDDVKYGTIVRGSCLRESSRCIWPPAAAAAPALSPLLPSKFAIRKTGETLPAGSRDEEGS